MRYCLERGDFEFMEGEAGYPRPHSPAALRGLVVHQVLEALLKELNSASDESAVQVLRRLGGIGAVISDKITETAERAGRNPRTPYDASQIAADLRAESSGLQTRVQQLLRRATAGAMSRSHFPRHGRSSTEERQHLGTGSHAELAVEHSTIPIMGVIDYLELSSDLVRITDFKTGQPDPSHSDQVLTYASIWRADSRNALPQAPIEAVVAYTAGDPTVLRPSASDLEAIEEALSARIAAAEALVTNPQPVLEADVCRTCSVRHLCDDYWSSFAVQSVAEFPADDEATPVMIDIEADVVERRSSRVFGLRTRSGEDLSLVAPQLNAAPGALVRVCNARVIGLDDDRESAPTAQATRRSEVFVLR